MKPETKVGRFSVPIRNYKYPSIATFSAGLRGSGEEGHYCFWTAVMSKKKEKKARVFGRARIFLPAGERFCRMRGKKDYRKMWIEYLEAGKNVKFVRPSTKREILSWAKTHKSDWRFIESLSVGKERFNFTNDLDIGAMQFYCSQGNLPEKK